MELTNCPMCQSSLPGDSTEPVTSCAACGADLTRYAAKRSSPPPLQPMAEEAVAMSSEFNLTHGILGALAGAAIGIGVMFGFFEVLHFNFPLIGVGTGLLTGYGARLLYKGGDQTLGIISAVIALLSVVGTLLLIYGIDDFPMLRIISVIVSASVAYRIAAR